MTLDPRAALTLDAHLSYLRGLSLAGGGQVVEIDGGLIFESRHPLPFLINGVARTEPTAEPAAIVAAGRRHFGARGFEVLCLAQRDEDLHTAALAAGLHAEASGDPLQYIDHAPLPAPADRARIEIRSVSDEAGVADIGAVNQDASAAYEVFPADVYATVFGTPSTVLAEHITAFVGYDAGRPVATAQLVRYRDIAYVGWVAVVRSAMRRGLGWLLTETVVNAGLAEGLSAAVLMASPMGAPLYRRMGFIDVGEVRNAYAPVAGAGDDSNQL
ncbi:MAG TPA: GNAT family N-acetyltransferase [Candidatus Limnocylindria bacterium]|nr:GNAT family N-acetyltransferase [Candidatus Limnocylindria bacterium]